MKPISDVAQASRTPAPPSGTTLSLCTDLRAVGAASALEWLHRERRSGFLRVVSGDHRKAVFLHEGAVVFAESNQRIDRLGPSLARAGLLSIETLHGANRDAQADERFGKTLVNRGDLEARQLWQGIRAQLEEIVWSLFAYREGELGFWQGPVAPNNLVRIDFDTTVMLQGGHRWAEELGLWIERARGVEMRIHRTAPPERWDVLEGIDAHLGEVLLEIESRQSGARFDALCRVSGIDEMTAARTLRFLEDLDFVRLDTPGGGAPETGEPSPEPRVAALRARLSLLAQVVDGLAEPLRGVRDRDAVWLRVREVFDEIAARFPGAMNEISLAPDLALPVDRLEKEMLESPNQLEGDYFAAIDAFVEYLEFEALNHPEIDGDAVLESQRGLRVAPLPVREKR